MSDSSELRVRWLPGFEHAELYDSGGYFKTIPRHLVVAMAQLAKRRAGNSWERALDEVRNAVARKFGESG